MLIFRNTWALWTGAGLALVLALALALFNWSHSMAGPPDIAFQDLEGKSHPLSEYIGKGKWTLVNVWGPRCPPCQEELPELVRFHDEHKDIDATVLGIALDYPSFGRPDAAEVARFAEDYLVGYPLLIGDADMIEAFGAGPLVGMPTSFAYTPKGELVAVQTGMITAQMIEEFIRDYSQKK
jgi:thiol-disulfide isomerase/thioredoxin